MGELVDVHVEDGEMEKEEGQEDELEAFRVEVESREMVVEWEGGLEDVHVEVGLRVMVVN